MQFANRVDFGTMLHSTELDAAANADARHGQSYGWQQKLAQMGNGDF